MPNPDPGAVRALTCGDAGGVREDGEPCGVVVGLGPDGMCIFHSPDRAEEARLMRVAGAHAATAAKLRSRAEREATWPDGLPPPPKTIDDAKRYAAWAVDAVAKGPGAGGIDGRTAREIAGLLREFRSSAEKAELSNRVQELEAALRKAKRELGQR